MQCVKLMCDLTDFIIEELLSNENVVHFYQMSIEFANSKLQQACETMIVRSFDTVMETQNSFLLSMPKKYLMRLFESDQLHIPSEYCLVELITKIIDSRKECIFLEPRHP